MNKHYLDISVEQALKERLAYLFDSFEHIFVSFSGGKDSGLLLNLVLDYRDAHCPDRVIGVFHQDFEAQYTVTTEYVTRTFKQLEKRNVERYWVCLPMATRTALSSYESYWYPWDDEKEALWVRPMPRADYVIHLGNNPITTYRYKMHQEDLAKQFGRWYRTSHGGGRTVCLLGIRAGESLQRYSGFIHKKYADGGQCYISKQFKECYTASPLYDWNTADVWHAYYKNGYDYNRLYDLYYMAGLTPDQMRVASPFNDQAKECLQIYRVIDPDIWTRLLGRVEGANFAAIYGKTKAMAYRSITLPSGHTWQSYTKFLLSTLPVRLRNQYIRKFNTSIRFWKTTGGGLDEQVVAELLERGYKIRLNGISNYTVLRHPRVVFLGSIPDHTDDIKSTKDIPSWKRMCYCILKNDHNCRFMGFGLTREQQRAVDQLRYKYRKVMKDGI